MMKMYCYDCNKDVLPIVKKEKNEYIYQNKTFEVLEDCYYCPNCHEEIGGEFLDKSLQTIYNGYLALFDLSDN